MENLEVRSELVLDQQVINIFYGFFNHKKY